MTLSAYSNITEHLIVKNTPAVTIVAAWIKADTGVGPSIASGSQVCKPNWADLPTTPKNKKNAIKSANVTVKLNTSIDSDKIYGANEKIVKKSTLPKKKIKKIFQQPTPNLQPYLSP